MVIDIPLTLHINCYPLEYFSYYHIHIYYIFTQSFFYIYPENNKKYTYCWHYFSKFHSKRKI